MTVTFNEKEHGKRLKDMLDEALNVKTKIKLYNDSISDMRKIAKEEMGVAPKQFNALLRILTSEKEDVKAQTQETIDIYESLYESQETTNLGN